LRLRLAKRIGKRRLCSFGAAALTCVAAHGVVAQEAAAPAAATAPAAKTASGSNPVSSRRASPRHAAQASAQHGKRARRRKTVARGQQKIDPERAQEIQEALVREHYLSSTASGTWNQASEDAMRKYQADHGWQSKTVPDSRALISLGLGPSHDHLLNPESAMTTGPDLPHGTASRSHGAPGANSPATQGASQPAPVKGQSNLPGTPSQINSQDSSTPQ
jgi:hypothetical protein